jgi:hypothetical protein
MPVDERTSIGASATTAGANPAKKERLRKAAVAAVLEIKSAGAGANSAAIAADAAYAQGVSPGEATNIAFALQREVETKGLDALTSESGFAAADAAAEAESGASDGSIGYALAATATPPPAVPIANDPSTVRNIVYRQLMTLPEKDWTPQDKFFESLGNVDREQAMLVIRELTSDGFVVMQSNSVFLTESGRRYVQYAFQGSSSAG